MPVASAQFWPSWGTLWHVYWNDDDDDDDDDYDDDDDDDYDDDIRQVHMY